MLSLTLIYAVLTIPSTICAAPPLAGADVFELEYASKPLISPDGKWILYNHVVANEENDRFDKLLICYDVENDLSRRILKKYDLTSTPTWSPDSKQFAIAATRSSNHSILFVKPGRTSPFKTYPTNVNAKNLTWSPSGRSIIFDGLVEEKQERLVDEPKEAASGQWAPAVVEIQRDIYRRDGQGYLPHGVHQLFLLTIEAENIRQLTESSYHHKGPFSWKGEKEILFSAQHYQDWEHTPRNLLVYSFNLIEKKAEVLIDIKGPATSPQSFKNGTKIAFVGYRDLKRSYQQNDIFIYDTETKKVRNLTADFDRDITSIMTLEDGAIFFRYDDRGVGKLGSYEFATETLSREVVTDIGGVSIGRPYQGGSFSVSNAGHLSYPKAALERPPEIAYTAGTATKIISNVTKHFTDNHRIGTVKQFRYKSSYDGELVDGWVVLPPGYSKSDGNNYPLVLEIHGGPFANYGSRFAMEPQLYAAAGYVVVYTNPRGSTSYGERFAQLIDKNYPQQGDFEDLMSAVDHAITHYSVDANRLYVTGGSGGGILTAWIVTKTDRFKAAVSQKPVINWESLAYTSDGYLYFSQYWFDGTPTDIPDEYRRRSPLSYANKVSTPTMLMTGEQDWRTPITEAEQFYHALKLNKVDTMLIRVPQSSHAIAARPSRIWMKLNYLTAWFERYKE